MLCLQNQVCDLIVGNIQDIRDEEVDFECVPPESASLGVNNEQSSEPNVDLSSDAVVMNACQDSDDVGCGVGGRRDH